MNEDDAFGYWNYYSNNFDWNKSSSFGRVNKEHSIEKFKDNGLGELEAIQLWESGYVYIEGYNIVIDRYYGGLLSSYDTTTRLMPSQVKSLFSTARSRVWIQSASSLEEVYKIVEVAKSKSSKPLHFRGQRQNYFIDRK